MIDGDTVIDLGAATDTHDLKSAITAQQLSSAVTYAIEAPRWPIASVTLLPVIPNPEKIFCIGLNYETHRRETGRPEVEHPSVFIRFADTQVGHQSPLIRPRLSVEFDFDGELAVIIGKSGRYIDSKAALEHVAGYALYNDCSVRDFQRHTHHFTPGKNFPGTGSFGPWMMTPDELGDPTTPRLVTRLNGKTVQDASISEMIFDIPNQIAYCSSFSRLMPGDVIITGTPGGVGAKRKPPLWMRPGDTVEVELERLGCLRNVVSHEV